MAHESGSVQVFMMDTEQIDDRILHDRAAGESLHDEWRMR
jgi:hypothetical protein